MDKIWYRKSFEVGGHWPLMKKPNDHAEPTKVDREKSTYSAACQFDIMF